MAASAVLRGNSSAGEISESDVLIVGGGLAGMAAALPLLERGCQVSLFESSDRLGGKAGADRHGDDLDEHAYHIFPAWYLNAQRLAQQLDLQDNFVDCSDITEIKRGEFPTKSYILRNITSWRSGPRNIFSGFIPPGEMFLFYYALCDLLSQPYSRRAFLDQISVSGLIRSKGYHTENVERMFDELILKGLSVPTYEISSMTMSQVMSYWVRYSLPVFRILRGNLQEFWIDPIRRRIELLGGKIYLEHRLDKIHIENKEVTRLEFETVHDGRVSRTFSADNTKVVLAIPSDKLASLVDDSMFEASPHLGEIRQLRSTPLAAFNIYFDRRIPDIPKGHVLLADSRYALSFIDISQVWEGYDTTVLNCMASDSVPLDGLTDGAAFKEVFSEMVQFMPGLLEGKIARVQYLNHITEPLFTNDLGAWSFRPSESTQPHLRDKNPKQIGNLHLAGDYCRTAIDLVSMEGAISSGLLAAEAIRTDLGIPSPVEVLEPSRAPTWIWWAIKVPTWPAAAALGMAFRFKERLARIPVNSATR